MVTIILNRLLMIIFFCIIIFGWDYIISMSKQPYAYKIYKWLYLCYVITISSMFIAVCAYIFATSTFGAFGLCSIVAIFYIFVVKS